MSTQFVTRITTLSHRAELGFAPNYTASGTRRRGFQQIGILPASFHQIQYLRAVISAALRLCSASGTRRLFGVLLAGCLPSLPSAKEFPLLFGHFVGTARPSDFDSNLSLKLP